MDPTPYALDYDSVMEFCTRQGLTFLKNDELKQLAIPRQDRQGWAIRVVPRPERGMLTVAYPLPGKIPDERLAELQKAANLLNSRTFLGAWVLNPDTKEMYFRQTVITDNVTYTDASVKELMQIVIGTTEMMVPRLQAVLQGAPAEKVVEES